MADEQINILIKAVDEATAAINNVNKNIQNFSKESKKQTESLGQSFTKLQGDLLVLGNAAASVDRIFSSYTNLQLRLENATERVTGAQERLADAQKTLTRLQQDGEASAEDLEDAQLAVDRATRGLTVSQNNLAKAQGAVVGTYINMGIQSLVLLGSIPSLIKAFVGFGTTLFTTVVPALTATTIAGAPLWAIILAIAAAIAGIILIIKNWDSVSNFLGDTWTWLVENVLVPALRILIEIAKWIEFVLLPFIIVWRLQIEALGIAFNWLLENVLKPVYDWLKNSFLSILEKVVGVIQWIVDNVGKVTSAIGDRVSSAYSNITRGRDATIASSRGISIRDGIVKPDGTVIKTDPRDTLVAMRNPNLSAQNGMNGGITLIIEGNIYGTDPDEIAEALNNKLRKRISV